MIPKIGINCNVRAGLRERGDGRLLTLSPEYVRCVRSAGAAPLLIPPLAPDTQVDRDGLEVLLDSIDGLVLTGGGDLNPDIYGENLNHETRLLDTERNDSDLALTRAALTRGMPILGICAGMQMVNVARGGSLHQHLADLRKTIYPDLLPIHDAQETPELTHQIQVHSGSRLADLIGEEELTTNSRHHQAIAQLGEGLEISALAEDGVIEAIEGTDTNFLICVQWHPEDHDRDERHQKLFSSLVKSLG